MTNSADPLIIETAKKLNGCIIALRAMNSLQGPEVARFASIALDLLEQLVDEMTVELEPERLNQAESLLSAMRSIFTSVKAGTGKLELNPFGLMDAFHRTPLLIVNDKQPISVALTDTRMRLDHHKAWGDLKDLAGVDSVGDDFVGPNP